MKILVLSLLFTLLTTSKYSQSKSDDFALVYNSFFVNLKVKVAKDKHTKENGLMGIKKLQGYNGMLFVYEKAEKVNMWMKNTYLPLDIIFINGNNKVSSIKKGVPGSTKIISSDEKVIAVLEIPLGCGNKLKIKSGSSINWIFKIFFENENIEYYHCLE